MSSVDAQTFLLLFLNDNFVRTILKLNRRYFVANTVSHVKTMIQTRVWKPGKFWLLLTIYSHRFLHYVPLTSYYYYYCDVYPCTFSNASTLIFKKLRRTSLNRLKKFENGTVVFESRVPMSYSRLLKPYLAECSRFHRRFNAHSAVHINCYNRIPGSGHSTPHGVQVVYTQQPLYVGTLVRMDALIIGYSIRFRAPCLL